MATNLIGQKIGAYEVVGKLGVGGMGEVYRARDSKIGRDIALKILPPLFASDPERLARFEREAKALGGLNHPNIAAIYGVEDRGPTRALVMELVEGEDLSARIARGPIPLDEALPIARQIADALSAAHDAGIIHRDLKPANIKIRDDGVVKVLDFGLAKAVLADAGTGSGDALNSPTLTARSTQLGMIIGTAAYMSPEQAKGRAVDKRADCWSFGVVFFEMLSGDRAFEGEDISDVLASVLKTEPAWSKLPADVPAPVRRFLGRCLEKDPRRRLRDIGEGMLQLDEGLAASSSVSANAAPASAIPVGGDRLSKRLLTRSTLLALGAWLIVVASLAWLWSTLLSNEREPATAVRFVLPGPVGASYYNAPSLVDFVLTPDGQALVYTWMPPGSTAPSLYIRRFDQFDPTPLRGTETGAGPFISPDGRWVGFVDAQTAGRLKKAPMGGGPASVLTQGSVQWGGCTWVVGTVICGSNGRGLFRIPENGGDPEPLTQLDSSTSELSHRWPSAVPGHPIVLFSTYYAQGPQTAKLAALDLTDNRVVRFSVTGTNPRYVSSGHIAFATADGVLRVVPFDVDRLEVTGTPSPIVEGIGTKPSGSASFDVSADGRLVYSRGSATLGSRTVAWVDQKGVETAVGTPPRTYFYARVSPDGNRISFDVRDQDLDVWIWNARGTMHRLTQNTGSDQYGLWVPPDGQRLVIWSDINAKVGLYIARADGIGSPELILERPGAFPNAVTPDGKTVLFRATTATAGNDLFSMPLDGEQKTVTPLIATEHDELNVAVSPDGKWIVFQSDLSGRHEIYVRPYPDVTRGQDLVSTAGGTEPVWSPTGTEIFYLSPDAKLMSVPVSKTPSGGLSFAPPKPIFGVSPYFFGGVGRNYDVTPDGKRFVMIKSAPTSATESEPIRVVLNWADELRRK